jgi:catechol 2,3-dioxygenase-like lactoylglutathione lyase family enzyme
MGKAANVKLTTLGTVLLGVSDLERALAFYSDALGITVRFAAGDQLAADFRDPDGHVLSILGPRAGAGPPGAR